MGRKWIYNTAVSLLMLTAMAACRAWQPAISQDKSALPADWGQGTAEASDEPLPSWRAFYADPYLIALIDSALAYNQELNILTQEVEIARNEVRTRRAEYLPTAALGLGAGLDRPGRFTRFGALEHSLDVEPGKPFPEPLTDYSAGLYARWELDIWRRLRNAKQAAFYRYLATESGRRFLVTQLVAEIAETYYELLALDNLLLIIERNIDIQTNALKIIQQQKEAAKVSQLAVSRFEAQLFNTRNLQYEVRQRIVELENYLYFLTGQYPSSIDRQPTQFFSSSFDSLHLALPATVLANRPDVQQSMYELEAAHLDLRSAKAAFLPSVGLSAGVGWQAIQPQWLLHPESLFFNLLGDALLPLINRNALFARYNIASAQQKQALLHYQQTMLRAYLEVRNQLAAIDNYNRSFTTKAQQVSILEQSVGIAGSLFNSARADYAEVLLTQREALDARMELIEVRLNLLRARVRLYRALGGGWQ